MFLVSDRRYRSALQVDEDVEQVRAGLEDLGIRGVATLRLDHRRQFVRKVDVGCLERLRI